MEKFIALVRLARDGAIAILACICIFLAFQVSASLDRFERDGGEISKQVSDTFDTINRPCGRPADPEAERCGTLAQAGKVLTYSSDLIAQSQRLEGRELTLFDQQIPPVLDQARGSLAALQIATNDLHPLILESQARIHDLQGAELASARLIDDLNAHSAVSFAQVDTATARLNALLADPAIPDTLHHIAGIAASSDAMLFTANRVETKATSSYLNPPHNPLKRTWQAVSPFLLPGAQIGAALVR